MHYLKTSGAKPFSHIYIEKGAAHHPNTQAILQKINYDSLIYIDDYSQIFNRHHQDFIAQKRSPNLILARKSRIFIMMVLPTVKTLDMHAFTILVLS